MQPFGYGNRAGALDTAFCVSNRIDRVWAKNVDCYQQRFCFFLGSGSSSQSQTVPAVMSPNATLSPTNKQSEVS